MEVTDRAMNFLGVDMGSSAIKLVILDSSGCILEGQYQKNTGILASALEGISRLSRLPVRGVGVTGNGRQFGQALLGADVVPTEIIAHFRGTLDVFPEVRTIFEIGGEDCKLIQVKDGRIENFQMNTLCGGGTGSFIETIAGRIGLPIEEFGPTALKSTRRIALAGKCGVFAQSSVITKLNSGFDVSDIAMGVTRALINNYFAMLVRARPIFPPFVFQGATALNPAIKRAFEEFLQAPVLIPQHPHLMGAVGAALMARDAAPNPSRFKGWENLGGAGIAIEHRTLEGCPNRCEVVWMRTPDGQESVFGQRCERCIPSEI